MSDDTLVGVRNDDQGDEIGAVLVVHFAAGLHLAATVLAVHEQLSSEQRHGARLGSVSGLLRRDAHHPGQRVPVEEHAGGEVVLADTASGQLAAAAHTSFVEGTAVHGLERLYGHSCVRHGCLLSPTLDVSVTAGSHSVSPSSETHKRSLWLPILCLRAQLERNNL